MKRLFFSVVFLLFFCFSSSGNNHSAVYKIEFDKGSCDINDKVINNTFSVYRSLPEKCFSKVSTSGVNEEDFTASIQYILAKNRALALVNFLVEKGMSKEHIKINFAGIPFLHIFKTESKKVEDLVINTENVEQNCNCYLIDVAQNNVIYTKNQNYYFISPYSFETNNGISINKGYIKLCVNEIDTEEKLQLGWHDLRSQKLHQPVYEFYIQASLNKQNLQLKKHSKIKLHINPRVADFSSGKLRWDNLEVWNKQWKSILVKDILFFTENMILTNYKETNYLKTDNVLPKQAKNKWVMELNALGWNRFSFELNANSEKEREFLILDDSPYMLRFVEDGTNLVYPVYGDYNFNNLYYLSLYNQQKNGKVLAIRLDEGSCWMVTQNIDYQQIKQKSTFLPEYQINNDCYFKGK